MVQFLSINFFSWISSIFVGVFKSSRFFCHPVFRENLLFRKHSQCSQFILPSVPLRILETKCDSRNIQIQKLSVLEKKIPGGLLNFILKMR